jgi:hypothetical protein
MTDAIGALLHVLLASAGLIAGLEPGTVTVFAVVVVAAALFVAVMHGATLPQSARGSLARPRRAIDDSAPLSQSDPDAAGHPRSRAPGYAASAA